MTAETKIELLKEFAETQRAAEARVAEINKELFSFEIGDDNVTPEALKSLQEFLSGITQPEEDAIRDEAISYIEGLYPPDAPYEASAAVGVRLLGNVIGDDWRDLPTAALIRLRDANELEHNAEFIRLYGGNS